MRAFASFSRRLLSRTCSTQTAARAPLKSIFADINGERDLTRLVDKFKTACAINRFRCSKSVYQVVVGRLASAGRVELIEDVIGSQKKYPNISEEGFCTRLIKLYGEAGLFDHALRLFDEMPELGAPRTMKSFNALLSAAVCSKRYERVLEIFERVSRELGVKPDLISYNILINAYCKMNHMDGAFSALETMSSEGIVPDSVSFDTLFAGFYKKGRFEEAEKIWKMAEDRGIRPTIFTLNNKLRGLASNGKTAEALEFLDEFDHHGLKPNIYSYNALIEGFCKDGNMEEAKKMYDDMAKHGFLPNTWTFEMMIPKLCEKGELDLAFEYSKESITRRSELDVKILQCVVDALAKESKMAEAKVLVDLSLSESDDHHVLVLPPSC